MNIKEKINSIIESRNFTKVKTYNVYRDHLTDCLPWIRLILYNNGGQL